jgi:hypothetical protein
VRLLHTDYMAVLLVMRDVLPVLARLSKLMQAVDLNFGEVETVWKGLSKSEL